MGRRGKRQKALAALLALALVLGGMQSGMMAGTWAFLTVAAQQDAEEEAVQEGTADVQVLQQGAEQETQKEEKKTEAETSPQAAAEKTQETDAGQEETQAQTTEAREAAVGLEALQTETAKDASEAPSGAEPNGTSVDGNGGEEAEQNSASEAEDGTNVAETGATSGDGNSTNVAETSGISEAGSGADGAEPDVTSGTGEGTEASGEGTDSGEPETAADTEPETEPTSEPESETEEYLESSAGLDALLTAVGSSVSGQGVAETARFVPGTYTVTANLYVPGEYNKVLKQNAYLTNPKNPSGIGGYTGVPLDPVSDNATLTIGEDGTTKTLTLDVVNPVFTLQSIGGASGVTIVKTVSDRESYTYSGTNGDVTRYGRITQLILQLDNNSGEYSFSNCKEFPTLLGEDWTVPLNLAVDLSTVPLDLTVELLSGDGGSWASGSTASLSFVAGESYSKYTGLTVDGTAVPDGSASSFAYQGNTMVDLPAAYLETLYSGSHTLKIQFQDDYEATASFTVTGTAVEPGTEANTEADTEANTEGNTEANTEPDTEETTEDAAEANQAAAQSLKAGTYTVTANLFVPGERNSQLPGVDAYMTNPSNPLGVGGYEGIPNTPVAENATLVVTEEGEKILILEVVNPVFTLQAIGSGSNNKVLKTQRDSEVYSDTAGTVSRNGRLTKLWILLSDDSGSYSFTNCKEFPTLLGVDWSVDLELSVDFTGAKRVSDSTDTGLTEEEQKGSGVSGETEEGSSKKKETETETEKSTEKKNTQTEGSGKLKAGKYTVAANIWIDKSSSGLPLSPHLTSSVFPPKDPVSRNATLTIDEDSNGTVVVPIVIQSKVMSVKKITGLDIIDSSYSGGYLTSITVDLGKITNPDAVITKTCTVSLDLGELAQTISGKGASQVWTATFQVNLSGIPSGSSGGGDVDVDALIAQAQSEEQTGAAAVRVSVLPGAEGLGLAQMMQEAKAAAEQTSSDSQTTSETESTVTWKFTVLETDANSTADEEQADSGSTAAEDGQRTEFVARLMNALKNGETDIVLCDVRDAAEWAAEADVDGLRILSLTEYSPREIAETGEAADGAEDGSVGDSASDGSPAVTISYVAAITTSSFLSKQETAVQKFISEQEESVTYAEEHHTETAAAALALGLYEDAAEAQTALDQTQLTLRTGSEMQPLVDAVLETNAPEEENYYVPGTQTAETEQTDADSLSAAIEEALAKRDEEAGENSTDTGDDGTSETGVSVSNPSGIDMEAQRAAAAELEPGTYTVSANLYLPGELNTQLPGVTAYMTNPDNPLGVGGHEGVPMTPVTDNATLVVGEDGTKTVIVDVVNPVFTLQGISAPQNSEILAYVRDSERYEGTNGVGVDGRITQLYIQLSDDRGVYPYDDCHEFPTLLETDWYVVLELSVEFTTAQKVSDDTTYTIPEDAVTP